LEYIPSSEKRFSSQKLITNLIDLHYWDTPSLASILITVQNSSFNEQFYFTFDLFLFLIPIRSYLSLKRLEIISPRMRPFHTKATAGVKEEISSMQLTHLAIQTESSTGSFSPVIVEFLKNQNNLQHLELNIGEPLRQELMCELVARNPTTTLH
jgi:hypothetical protein